MIGLRAAAPVVKAVRRTPQVATLAGVGEKVPGRKVNDHHVPDRNAPPVLEKRSNKAELKLRDHHRAASLPVETLNEFKDEHVMATWGPTNTLKGVPTITHGKGVYLYDSDGKEYLDWTSQAVCTNLGHSIPDKVKKAIDDQLSDVSFVYSGMANTEVRSRLSKLMSEITPKEITGFLFPTGGGEANEAAIRIARRFTGKQKIITHYRSYHGGTTSSLAATGDFRRWFGESGATGFVKTFNPSPFHFPMGETPEEAGAQALAMLEEQILMEGPNTVAAIMMESVIGAGGTFKLPLNYVQGVRALCDKYDILLILDEVMVGFGRTGEFWGYQHYEGVVPDITTSAKGLTGSFLPLAMVGVRTEIKEFFDTNPLGWGATYHAHPVSLACAYAVIQHMIEEDVIGHVKRIEPAFINGLQRLLDDHPSVHQARGLGLFGCLELVNTDRRLLQQLQGPPAEAGVEFKKALADNGVIGLVRLPLMHAAPPLNITEEELSDGFDRVSRSLKVLDQAM